MQRGLWYPPSRVFAVFEHSARLAHEIQKVFTGITINADPYRVLIEGCFMPKSVVNPFLEMADCIANAVTKNVKHQRTQASSLVCTPTFQSLFRDPGLPMVSYFEVTAVG